MSVEGKHQQQSTAKTEHQSSPVTMLISIWCMVSIQEWLYSGIVDPVEKPSVGLCLKPLPHSEEEGVGKKENQKCQQSNQKEGNMLAMKVPDVAIMQPDSNLHIIGIIKECDE